MVDKPAYDANEMANGLDESRAYLLKHLKGVTEEQMDWKPYPECKSIRETLQHLVSDDLAGIASLQQEGEPNYDAYQCQLTDTAELLNEMAAKRKELIAAVRSRCAGMGPLAPVTIWGMPMALAQAVSMVQGEDAYHAGQIAFVRMATDPAWDYYKQIYS